MQTKNKGFTLIELMIVVAIVAILAAVAIPAYQDYLTRSKVAEIAATAGACKTSVSEYYAFAGSFPSTDSSGCSTTQTQYVDSLAVAAGTGVITVTGRNIAPASGTITLTPNEQSGEITDWACGGSIATKYRPASCRN